jgi:hypothetical protein
MSELTDREAEAREAAKTCASIPELARKMKWPIGTADLANTKFELGLEWVRPSVRVPHVPRELPKPKGKAKA